jgi:hypothetical protein
VTSVICASCEKISGDPNSNPDNKTEQCCTICLKFLSPIADVQIMHAPAEPVLQFRLSSPREFYCSLCIGNGIHKKGFGSFTVVGTLDELVASFKDHVEHHHFLSKIASA